MISFFGSVVSSLAVALLVAVVSPALAGQGSPSQQGSGFRQSSPAKTGWVFEVHLGAMPERVPGNVSQQQLPAPGPNITTPEGNTSRQVPSWYFGDGAALANAMAGKLGGLPRIVPLDPVLTAAATTFHPGVGFGVRFGHTITSRVLVLFSYDQVSASLPLTGAAQAAIAATNGSFKPFFDAFLAGVGTTTTSSTLTTTSATGTERIPSVTAEVRIATIRGWTPYVALGGGLALPVPAVESQITLLGRYDTTVVAPGRAANGARVSETDQLQVRYELQAVPVGVVGVGVERDVQRHIGVRGEFRSFLNANTVRTRIDARPLSGPTPPPTVNLRGGVNPDIQLSTIPNRTTSLSLQGVDHFDAFEAKGALMTFSAGVFVRF